MPYIYLVHCRACLNANQPIYKIGKTTDFNKRLLGYDKGTVPLLSLYVAECDNFERHLINIFKSKFTLCTDYGNEYFEGDITSMIKIIIDEYEKADISYKNNTINEQSVIFNQAENIIKTKKLLLSKLNKVSIKNINNFRNNISMSSSDMHLSRHYNELFNIIGQYGYDTSPLRQPQYMNKLKFGDYVESKYSFISNLAMANDIPSIKLIERIKMCI